jgi:hypothetical protein
LFNDIKEINYKKIDLTTINMMRQKDILPWYEVVLGAIGLFHFGAVFLALLAITSSVVVLVFDKTMIAALLAFLGTGILLIQFLSRIRHILDISYLRVRNGQLQVFDPATKRWLPSTAITEISKKDYPYPDPWRPITIGYPGLELHLRDRTEAIEHLFAPGMEVHRDEVFDLLKRQIVKDTGSGFK